MADQTDSLEERVNGREPRKAQGEQVVLDHAARLFVEKGFHGTSLKDIADAMGVSRAAIYYYFPNKEAVLTALFEDLIISAAQEVEQWQSTAVGTPTERLRSLIHDRVLHVVRRGLKVRLLDLAEAALPESLARQGLEAKRRILNTYIGLIREGIRAGAFRPVDPPVAALGLIGMVNWTVWWFDPARGRNGEDVAAALSEMAVASLVRQADAEAQPASVPSLLHQVRAKLDHLEALFAAGKAD